MVPYLLYCFVMDHSRETCERIYKVRYLEGTAPCIPIHPLSCRSPSLSPCGTKSAPNVSSTRMYTSHIYSPNATHILSCSSYPHLRFLQSQCSYPLVPHQRHSRRCCLPALRRYHPDAMFVSFLSFLVLF